jgi:hypothetical protein
MKKILLSCAAMVALAGCGSGGSKGGEQSAEDVAKEMAALKMRPGQWEATNEVVSANAPGLPAEALRGMVGQKSTVSNCVTPEQAAKPSANFLAAQSNNKCTYQDWSMEGGRMSGAMTCEGGQMPGKVAMTLSGNYGSTAYDLDMAMKTLGLPGGATMLVKARITGRRTGQCTAT